MTELKRCPFCGGEVAIDEASGYLTSWKSLTGMTGKPFSTRASMLDGRTFTH